MEMPSLSKMAERSLIPYFRVKKNIKNTPNFVKMAGKMSHVFLLPYFLVSLKASINNQ